MVCYVLVRKLSKLLNDLLCLGQVYRLRDKFTYYVMYMHATIYKGRDKYMHYLICLGLK